MAADLTEDVFAALRLRETASVRVALATGGSFDRVAIVAAEGVDAADIARAVAHLAVAAGGETGDEVWDRLAFGARKAFELKNRSQIIACAIAWRGRGRIVGPLDPDLLIRFGVSTWR